MTGFEIFVAGFVVGWFFGMSFMIMVQNIMNRKR